MTFSFVTQRPLSPSHLTPSPITTLPRPVTAERAWLLLRCVGVPESCVLPGLPVVLHLDCLIPHPHERLVCLYVYFYPPDAAYLLLHIWKDSIFNCFVFTHLMPIVSFYTCENLLYLPVTFYTPDLCHLTLHIWEDPTFNCSISPHLIAIVILYTCERPLLYLPVNSYTHDPYCLILHLILHTWCLLPHSAPYFTHLTSIVLLYTPDVYYLILHLKKTSHLFLVHTFRPPVCTHGHGRRDFKYKTTFQTPLHTNSLTSSTHTPERVQVKKKSHT